MKSKRERLIEEIGTAINRVSAENGSNTPDFMLAEYLVDCLAAWDRAVTAREKWYGRAPIPVPLSRDHPPDDGAVSINPEEAPWRTR